MAMADDSEDRLRSMVADLPEQIDRWRRAECEFYAPETLYRYINGGAELYISYRFVAMASQPYVDETGDEMRLDVFDMGSAADAFGVFCHSREAVDDFVAPDVASEYAGGLLHFWKGRYYASILAYPESAAKKAMVRQLARTIAAGIDAASDPPAIVALLPEAMLVPYSTRYFRHHAWINEYHRFAETNVLSIEPDTEVVMARVRTGASTRPAVLLAALYPTTDRAEAARLSFTRALLPAAVDGLGQDADGGWLGCLREAELVVVVADAPTRESAAGLLRDCARRHAKNRSEGSR
jgi:hypothetical protein